MVLKIDARVKFLSNLIWLNPREKSRFSTRECLKVFRYFIDNVTEVWSMTLEQFVFGEF